ncbi:hypothetical protein [Caulobacter sp. BK020]|uniref:hypothetical protein n=1 Tax=Caulobacter sp. BK020 TaxID=2512117 RepID=UPI00104E4CA5|nr:hypothetical protein [Caulobacter sp. BK020]TCS13686.1 hypothetical protein EV278_109149 [Caulobacter sp. BK020]
MIDGASQPTSLEDISAGLLNGALLALLGSTVAGFIAWQIVAQLSGWLPDLKAMTAGLPPVDFKAMTVGERRAVIWDSVTGVMLLVLAGGFIRSGIRLIGKSLALLRARRG